jgi:intracellular septation protein
MKHHASLHLLNEFAPVIAFFITAQIASFYTATAVFMAMTVLALSLGWYVERRIPLFPIITGFFVLISGAITLWNHAPDALILADSLYYLSMGFFIWGGLYFFRINLLKHIFASTFAIEDAGWLLLARRWVVIFLLAGLANEIARHFLTPEAWVHFKVLKVITVGMFGFYQFTASRRYRIPELSNEWGLRLKNPKEPV